MKLIELKRAWDVEPENQELEFLYNQALAKSGQLDMDWIIEKAWDIVLRRWPSIPIFIYLYVNARNLEEKIKAIESMKSIALVSNNFLGNLDDRGPHIDAFYDSHINLLIPFIIEATGAALPCKLRYSAANSFAWLDIKNECNTLEFMITALFREEEDYEDYLVGISGSLGLRAKQVSDHKIRSVIRETLCKAALHHKFDRVRQFAIIDMANAYLIEEAADTIRLALNDPCQYVRYHAREQLQNHNLPF